ncbi:MAG: hypothetical protein ED559_10930 [Phycisphaera sp.]|nr:MAG: hypothetical protein ED559_10930 [Phycisphaera sp.]
MKPIAPTCAVLVAATVCLALAGTASPAALASQPEALPTLSEHMGEMSDAFRTISRGYNKADKLDDVLEAIGTLQQNIVASKSMVPSRLSEMSGEELETSLTEYRVRMAKLLDRTAELEVALLTGDEDLAHMIIRDELYPMRDEGHELFSD